MASFRKLFAALGVAAVRRQRFAAMRRLHPDKAGHAHLDTVAMLTSEWKRFEDWREENPAAPPRPSPPRAQGAASSSRGYGSGAKPAAAAPGGGSTASAPGGARPAAPGGGSTSAAPGASPSAPSFPGQPHCSQWEAKHGRLGQARAMEYRFLYAASAGCATCVRFYAAVPGFNPRCVSTGLNARGWASQGGGQLSEEMDRLLRELGL